MIIIPCCEYSKNNYPGPEIRRSLKIDNLNGLIIDLKGAFKSNFSLLTKMSGKPEMHSHQIQTFGTSKSD